MSEKSKLLKNIYNEELVVAAGLNICLTEKINLCDLLRIDYEYELRMEVATVYLNHLKPSEALLFYTDLRSPPMNSILLLEDWGLIITFPHLKVALNCSKPNYSAFTFESEYPKAYIALNVCIEILLWDSSENIEELLVKASSPAKIARLKSDMTAFIYSVSKVTAKNLLMKYSEAKDLFSCESSHSSLDNLCKKSGDLPPIAKRFSNFKSLVYENFEENQKKSSENTESLEYSESEGTEKIKKIQVARFTEEKSDKSQGITLKRDLEEIESPRFTSLESSEHEFIMKNQIMNEKDQNKENTLKYEMAYLEKTPEVSPKNFEYPTKKIKLFLKLQQTHYDSTNTKSYETEGISFKSVTELPQHNEKKGKCYDCEICLLL